MKKHMLTIMILAAAGIIVYALMPLKAGAGEAMDQQKAHWQEMQTAQVNAYDTHITDLQKRYDCAVAATSYDALMACNQTNYPERGCP